MILLSDQALLATHREKTIKTLLQRLQFGRLNIHNGRDFSMAIKTLLVCARQTQKADTTQQHQSQLGSKC